MTSNMQQGYEAARAAAAATLAAANPADLAQLSDTEYVEARSALRLRYLGQFFEVEWPSGTVRDAAGAETPPATGVLLLNYILSANRQQPTGKLIAFREIPGAAAYEPSFLKRAVNPLVNTFNGRPELFAAVASRLDGVPAGVADSGFTILVLPLLPVTYGVWHGDEEFPPSGVVLFDASAKKLLTVECLVVAASNGVYAMAGMARAMGT